MSLVSHRLQRGSMEYSSPPRENVELVAGEAVTTTLPGVGVQGNAIATQSLVSCFLLGVVLMN